MGAGARRIAKGIRISKGIGSGKGIRIGKGIRMIAVAEGWVPYFSI